MLVVRDPMTCRLDAYAMFLKSVHLLPCAWSVWLQSPAPAGKRYMVAFSMS